MTYKIEEIERARALFRQQRFQETLDFLEGDYLKRQPDCRKALHLKGMALMGLKAFQHSADVYRKLTQTYANPAYYANLSRSLFSLEDYSAARTAILKAQALEPNNIEHLWFQYHIALTLKQSDEVVQVLLQAHYRQPDNLKVLMHLAVEALNARRFLMARAYFKKLWKMAPVKNPNWLVSIGDSYRLTDQHAKSIKWYKKALKKLPNDDSEEFIKVQMACGLEHMKLGQWQKGMRYMAGRLKNALYLRFSSGNATVYQAFIQHFPQWQGESLENQTLYLIGEQGMGDIIQFMRFATQIPKAPGRRLVYIGSQATINVVKHLYRHVAVFDEIRQDIVMSDLIPKGEGYHVHWFDLISRLNLTPDTIDGQAYLNYPAKPFAALNLPDEDKGRFKIGLVWKGNHEHKNDHNRSMKLDDFLPLLDIENVKLFSLQKNADIDAGYLAKYAGLIDDYGRRCKTFAATAYVIRQLDVVITIDTSVAHLAGALGKRVLLLLPSKNSDWRWGPYGQSKRSLWYQSMRLFWQQGDQWDSAIEEVARYLRKTFKV